jgi:hypothetical protein
MTEVDSVSAATSPKTIRSSVEKSAPEVKGEVRSREDVELTLQIDEQRRLDELTYEKLIDRKRLAEQSATQDDTHSQDTAS